MNTVRRIAKNTGVQIIGKIINMTITLVIVIFLARYLGDAGYGKYSFVFAFISFFMIVTDLGIDTILVREIARDQTKSDKIIGNAIVIKFFLAILALLLSFLIIGLIKYPSDTTLAVYVVSLTLFFSCITTITSIFNVNLKMEYFVISKVIGNIATLLLTLFVIFYLRGGLVEIVLVYVISGLVSQILIVVFSRKFVKPKLEMDFTLWKNILREAAPIALTTVLTVIYFRIDIVMLSVMVGDECVGWYSAAYRLMEATLFIPSALMVSLYPLMSKYFKSSREALEKSYEKAFKYLYALALPLAVGTTLLADRIILVIYGNEFINSIQALQILIWAGAIIFITNIFASSLTSINKQKIITYGAVLMVILNIVLNYLLIPKFWHIGAGFATIVTEGFGLIYGFYFASKYLKTSFDFNFIKPIISSALISILIIFLNEINLLLLVFLSIIVYFAILMKLKYFTTEDIELFTLILKKHDKRKDIK